MLRLAAPVQFPFKNTPLALLLLILSAADVDKAEGSVAAAADSALTYHIAYASCPTHRTQNTDHVASPPYTVKRPPHCTISMRVLRHSPHPTWQSVLNQTILPASSPFFTYTIPAAQRRCQHQTVLRCVSANSVQALTVVPRFGFFHVAVAGRQPTQTFVIVDGSDCLEDAASSLQSSPLIRLEGLCVPDDKQWTHSSQPSIIQPPIIQNLSHVATICPARDRLSALPLPITVPARPPRRSRPPASAREQVPYAANFLWTRILLWFDRYSRGRRTEQLHAFAHNGRELLGVHDVTVMVRAVSSFRSWLLVLCGTSICSAVVVVWLILRLTQRIEMH